MAGERCLLGQRRRRRHWEARAGRAARPGAGLFQFGFLRGRGLALEFGRPSGEMVLPDSGATDSYVYSAWQRHRSAIGAS